MSDVLPYSNVRASLSRIASDGANTDMRCAQWNKKMYAKERYTGDFDVKTPHPVLVLSNRYDPSTPLAAAKNLTATFEGSVLLEQNGYGHTTLSVPSLCTAKVVRAYFSNGTLPAEGTICEIDRGFESVDDAELLKAVMLISEKMSRSKLR
ncbi:hypothetical protein AFLA_007539 [Aspergillus flavus NRRL3357]|nr:hypothetical protein AFLA_007539 [Aspergillus flavus NRRL3357]